MKRRILLQWVGFTAEALVGSSTLYRHTLRMDIDMFKRKNPELTEMRDNLGHSLPTGSARAKFFLGLAGPLTKWIMFDVRSTRTL